MNCTLIKRENLDIDAHGVMSNEDEGRGQGDIFTRQETPKTVHKPPETTEKTCN